MLGKGALERQPNRLHTIWRSVLVLMFFVPSSSSISTEILVDPLPMSSGEKSWSLEVEQHPNADGADLVVLAEMMPQGGVWPTFGRQSTDGVNPAGEPAGCARDSA